MSDTDPTPAESSCPSADELREFVAGRLGTQRTDDVAGHVEECTACQRTLETLDNAEASIDAVVAPGGDLQFADEAHCGRAVDAAARDSSAGGRTIIAPQRVGEFELLEPLGEGGMGTVYKARHASLGTTYAVKLLHPRRQADLATIERFQREMVALGRLDHPNIVRAVDAGEEAGVHYLVMEYIDGVDLGRALLARGPMSIANACEAARQAAKGLAYVHQQGRVHRDVKPSNLMVASDGTVKLLDLGLARVEEYALDEPAGATDDILGGGSTVELTRTHQVMGTLEYMSPEQASNSKTVDEKADLYSLGCTLYKMLTGRSPFASDQSVTAMSQLLAHVEKPAPPVREHRPDVPEDLARLLNRLLAKNPQERPQSADEVAMALAPLAAGSDLAKLARVEHPPAERDTDGGSSKTVVLPRSDDRIEPKRSTLPWGPILLGIAGLCVLLVCPVGLAIMAFMWRSDEQATVVAPAPTVSRTAIVQQLPDNELLLPDSGEEGQPVDLLALLDPQRDIRGNDWQVVDGALVSQTATPSMLQFAYRPPDHYRWAGTVERLENSESLVIGLAAGDAPLIVMVDGYPGAGSYSGIYRLDNENATRHRENVHVGQVLRQGQPTRLRAWVRRQAGLVHVRLEADGREVFSWRGRVQRSRGTGNFPPTQPGVLFLGNWTASFRVSDVQVTPLNGAGEVIEFADPVENIDLAAAQRAVWKGGIVTLTDDREVTGLRDLTSQDHVREIDMQGSEWLNDEDLLYFAGLNDLQRLNLSGTAVSNEGLRLLGPLPALIDLSLADTGLSRDHPQLGGDYPSLERLNLAATGIGNETLAAVSQLAGLTSLDVSATRVTDEALAHLSGLDRLRLLNLTQTAVSDAGLEQLPALPELEQLSLSGTRVREAAGITTERLPSLARVNLLETDISGDAVARLRELPGDTDVITGTDATNLLNLIDPQRDGYRGIWNRADDGASLRVPLANPARLAIPVTLPDEFDLEVVAVNNDGGPGHGPVFGLPLPGGGRPLVGFDHWPGDPNGPWTILHGINGRMERNSPAKESRDVFTDGTPVRLTIRVRENGVWVERNGEQILSWEGDVSQLAAGAEWFTADRTRPTIGLYNTSYTIPELTLTPVTGRVGLPHFRPTHSGSDRSVAEWVLAHGGSVQVRFSDDDPAEPRFRAGDPLPERPFWMTRIADLQGNQIPRDWLKEVGTLDRLAVFHVQETVFDNADLAHLAAARTLQEADFWGSPLDDDGMQTLAQLPNLRSLWIGNTQITAEGIAHFSGHPSLRMIGAAKPSLTDDVFDAAASIPNLVQLSLWRSSVTGAGLAHLAGHPSLQRLYLGRSDDFDPVHLNQLSGIPNLTAFQCAASGLKSEDMEPLSRLTQLSDLRVHQNPLGDEGISRLVSLRNLTRLNMAGVGATNASLKALQELHDLQILDISGNPRISDASVALLLVHQNLRQLSLGGTNITPSGVRRLQNGLPACQIDTDNAASAGRTIDLSQRGVTDETLPIALDGVPPTTLILEGPGITDASMALVASLPGLQRLELHRTQVTNDALTELANSVALNRLELWNMPQITEAATEHIAAIPGLKRVVLKSTGIYGPGLERLHDKGLLGLYIGNSQLDGEMLEKYILPFGTLNELDLAGAAITDDDVALLTRMELNSYLHLGYNSHITGPGLQFVADMPGVSRLILNASGVDDEGLRNLAGAQQIQRLFLRKTAVSDASVETIAALPNLIEVSVSDTNVTADGLARLRELLPGVTITATHLETPEGYPPPDAELVVDGGWKPTFSAGGGELVYGLPQGTGLEIINLETRERRLLSEEGKDAAWSPRGDWIASTREPFHNSELEEIWIIRPDGSEERKVADGLYPFWIDGGATVVFFSRETSGLMSIDVDQPAAEPQAFRASVPSFYCDATQDGAYLAWGYGGKIEIVERSSGQVVFEHQFAGDSTGLPSFSPDGRYVAYAPFGGDDRGVWIFDWHSGAAVRFNESNYWSPAWSSDGSRLAFDYRAPGTDTRETSVWIMDLAGRLPASDDE